GGSTAHGAPLQRGIGVRLDAPIGGKAEKQDEPVEVNGDIMVIREKSCTYAHLHPSDGGIRTPGAEVVSALHTDICRRQGGRWAAAFPVERAVMRPTGRRHIGNADRGSRRRG